MALLNKYGGLYLDFDVLILSSLSPYWKLLHVFEFVMFGAECHPNRCYNEHGMLMSRPGSLLTTNGLNVANRAHQTQSGCQVKCTKLDQLPFHATLGSFWKHSDQEKMSEADPCSYIRIP